MGKEELQERIKQLEDELEIQNHKELII